MAAYWGSQALRGALRRVVPLAALAVSCMAAQPIGAAAQQCAGDCSGDGLVNIGELVRAVNILLETASLTTCPSADADDNGSVTISDLVRAVNSVLTGCPDDGPPDMIVFERLNLQPEGIEYDTVGQRFLVGSRTEGIIHAVDDDGAITVLVSEPGLTATLGMHIDRTNDRLVVAGSLDASNNLALGIYALTTGEIGHVVDLSLIAPAGGHLANDVVTDSDGNAYVTDTLTPGIYRVDTDGNPSLFADSPQLANANGIEIYQDEYLIVARLNGPTLMRVPLDDPAAVTAVTSDIAISGDGIAFAADGDLVIVGGLRNQGTVLRLRSDDDWQSTTVVGTWDATKLDLGSPTTAAVRGSDVHVIFAHLFDTARTEYEIVRVDFDAAP